MKLTLKVIVHLITLTVLLLSIQNPIFAQISVIARYGKGIVNNDLVYRTGAFRVQYAIAENDYAFGIQVPIVKKLRLFAQAEMEIQKKEYQTQLVNYKNIFLKPGNPSRVEFYDNAFYHVKYTAHQFPVLIRKEFQVIPNLSVSVAAGFLLKYTFVKIDSDVLTLYGQEISDYSFGLTKDRLVVDPYYVKDAPTLLNLQRGGTPKIASIGVAYNFYKFKVGAEYRYTSHFILPEASQAYSSVNATLAYNLSKIKKEAK